MSLKGSRNLKVIWFLHCSGYRWNNLAMAQLVRPI